MSESVIKTTGRLADENQARRTERGIVAGYIHELSQRHEGHAADLDAATVTEGNQGG